MSQQIQAPPNVEDVQSRETYEGPIPRPFKVWTEDYGWCSACFDEDKRIVLMGTEKKCVGICAHCLAKLADGMRGSPSEGVAK